MKRPKLPEAGVEEHPWKALSYVLYILQFMGITLDLFMDTSTALGWHYAITTIEIVVALYLSGYQIIRLAEFGPSLEGRKCKPSLLLLASFAMQMTVVGLAAYSYDVNSDAVEWTFFGIAIAWGIINPMTFEAVAYATAQDEDENRKSRMGPASAMISIFTQHFMRTPWLCALGTLFAIAQAILNTYQGAVINDLTKAVTSRLDTTAQEVEELSFTLVAVWLATNVARLIFDVLSATMFSKLEIWLRDTVFDRSVHPNGTGLSLADYQARYASDVTGVVSLYATLLRGVVVNVLLIITSFTFLAIEEWKVATVTLAFLALGVTSGPTDLAGNYARQVQNDVTRGLSLMQDPSNTTSEDPDLAGPEGLEQQHREEVLVPLKTNLFRKFFFSNAVDSFNLFYSSFLTAIVVITMSWNVFNGEMESSEFLGIYFVFKQLQKPATKLSGIVKKAVSKTANLERINGVIFDSPAQNDSPTDSARKYEPAVEGQAKDEEQVIEVGVMPVDDSVEEKPSN